MKANFKEYNQQQNWLFPPSIEDLIPEDHPARIVNGVIEQLDLKLLTEVYAKEGRPSYHPKMLLKVMVYAYMDNIYSSRKIEKALKENINFMWLSGNQVVDHNTVARFRSNRLKETFKDIFRQVVMLLAEEGLVSLKEVYTDGTKIESVAGRYTFVWGNAIKKNKEKMAEQLNKMWEYANSIADSEDDEPDPTPPDFTELSPEKVKRTVENIENKIRNNPKASSKSKAKLRYIKNNFATNLKRYGEQEEVLQERSSYSKTDPDATFMRMKEDHMKNGQLKPGYNVQISTENQIIVHYSIHQKANDIHTLKPHIESYQELYEALPDVLTADAGYGSEENYDFLEAKGIETYVKYNTFDKDQKKTNTKKDKREVFNKDNLYYNENEDFYVCPTGQRMEKIAEYTSRTKSGHKQKNSIYEAKNCRGCPLRGVCFKGANNRKVQRNHNLERQKERVKENLLSDIGVEYRKKRSIDVEPVFGHIKYNRNFNRFTHRGIGKVEIEFGLHALANNLKKKRA